MTIKIKILNEAQYLSDQGCCASVGRRDLGSRVSGRGRGRVVGGGRGALLLRGQLGVEAAPAHIAPCSPGHGLVIAGGHGGHLETIDTLLSINGVMSRMSSLTCCT